MSSSMQIFMYSRIILLSFTLSCICGLIVPQNESKNRQIRAFNNIEPQIKKEDRNVEKKEEEGRKKQIPILNISKINQTKAEIHLKSNQTIIKNDVIKLASNTTGRLKIDNETRKFPSNDMESGAMTRGVFVIIALCMIILAYIGIRSYCLDKRRVVVLKKYGVRAKRSDVEMTPLPLDEDEDDETLFDVGNINR